MLERAHDKDEHADDKTEDLGEIVCRSAEILHPEIDHYAAHEREDQHAPPRVVKLRFNERFVNRDELFVNSRQVHDAAYEKAADVVTDDDKRQVDDARLVLFFYVAYQLPDLARVKRKAEFANGKQPYRKRDGADVFVLGGKENDPADAYHRAGQNAHEQCF